jgi:hypothetical protein
MIVSSAYNRVGSEKLECGPYAAIQENVPPAPATAPGWEHVVGELDFFFVDQPLALGGICLGKKYHMEMKAWVPS